MWVRVLNAKYKVLDRCGVERVMGKSSTWWRDLLKVCGGDGEWFDSNVRRGVGDEGSALFWFDTWSKEEGPLKRLYARLFDVSE